MTRVHLVGAYFLKAGFMLAQNCWETFRGTIWVIFFCIKKNYNNGSHLFHIQLHQCWMRWAGDPGLCSQSPYSLSWLFCLLLPLASGTIEKRLSTSAVQDDPSVLSCVVLIMTLNRQRFQSFATEKENYSPFFCLVPNEQNHDGQSIMSIDSQDSPKPLYSVCMFMFECVT